MTANRLNVFSVLGEDQLSATAIAARCGCHPRSMKLLLNACVALGFLEKHGRQFANTPSGREVLLSGKPAYIGDGINHADALWYRWAFLTDSVRSNRSARTPPGPVDGATGYRDFILAMHNRAMRNAGVLADHLDLTGRRHLFDAGGGPGTYSIFLLRKHPKLSAIIFDLPPAIEIARQIVDQFGMTERVTFRPGNFHEDDFGEGNDIVSTTMTNGGFSLPIRRAIEGEKPILVDEWRLPASFDRVRRAVDEGAEPASFLLTGSATPADPPFHSGAGRIVRVRLRPMTLVERGIETPTVSLAGLLRRSPSGARARGDRPRGLC